MSFTSSQERGTIRVFKDTNGHYTSFKSGYTINNIPPLNPGDTPIIQSGNEPQWIAKNFALQENEDIDLSPLNITINGTSFNRLNISDYGAIHFSNDNNPNPPIGGVIGGTINLSTVENNTIIFMGEYLRFIPDDLGRPMYYIQKGVSSQGVNYIAFEFRAYFRDDSLNKITYRVYFYEGGLIDVVVKNMISASIQKIYIGYKKADGSYIWPTNVSGEFTLNSSDTTGKYFENQNLTGLCARFNLTTGSRDVESQALIKMTNLTSTNQCSSSTLSWTTIPPIYTLNDISLYNSSGVVQRSLTSNSNKSELPNNTYYLEYKVKISDEEDKIYTVNTRNIVLTDLDSSFNITVNGSKTSICHNEIIRINKSSSIAGTWSVNNNLSTTNTTENFVEVKGNNTSNTSVLGVVTFTTSNGNCTKIQNLIINPLPTINLEINTVCQGSDITFKIKDANPNYVYSVKLGTGIPQTFTNVSSQQTLTLINTNNLVAGTNYTFELTALIPSSGCVKVETLGVEVRPSPINPTSLILKNGNDIIESTIDIIDLCNSNKNITLKTTDLIPSSSVYKWYLDDNLIDEGVDSVIINNGNINKINSISVIPVNNNSNIKLYFKDIATQCRSNIPISRNIKYYDLVNDINDVKICHGDKYDYTFVKADPLLSNVTFEWRKTGENIGMTETSGTNKISTFIAENKTNSPIETIITVTATLNSSSICTTTKTFKITVLPLPKANLNIDIISILAESNDMNQLSYPDTYNDNGESEITHNISAGFRSNLKFKFGVTWNNDNRQLVLSDNLNNNGAIIIEKNNKIPVTEYQLVGTDLSFETGEIDQDTVYKVILYNANGCKKTITVHINMGPEFYAVVGNHVSCSGKSDGSIKIFTSYITCISVPNVDSTTICDSCCYDSCAYDSCAYDSCAYDSCAYDSCAYDSCAYDSCVFDSAIWDSAICDSVIITPNMIASYIQPPIKVYVNDALWTVLTSQLTYKPYEIKGLPEGFYGIKLVDGQGNANTRYVTIGEAKNNFSCLRVKLNLNDIISKNNGYVSKVDSDATVYLVKNKLNTLGAFTNTNNSCNLHFKWSLGETENKSTVISKDSNVEIYGNDKVNNKVLYLTVTNSNIFNFETKIKITLKTTPFMIN